MKKSIILTFAFVLSIVSFSFAQDMMKKDHMMKKAKTINLEQTTGEFTIQSLTLPEGDYVFEIANNSNLEEVGFVVAPKGKTDQPNHIKEAYVKNLVAKGAKETTNVVSLTKGEYVYFCPLNKTPQYILTVE